jgi:hypothetical protein
MVISAAVVCIVIGSTQLALLGKKAKEDVNERLHSLKTIYVDGSKVAVSYISENLVQETCLNNTSDKEEADALLEVWEESPVPCGTETMPQSGVCTHIQAKLFDAKTNKMLWFREDQHFPALDPAYNTKGPYKWVLWNLNNSCCKGRPLADPSQDSKE